MKDYETEDILILAGWLRYHDRVDGGPRRFASPLGRLIVHDAEDRRDWEKDRRRPKPPIGAEVDLCIAASKYVSQIISDMRCGQKVRDQMWLLAAHAWLSPDGKNLHFADNGKLVAWLGYNGRRSVSRLPIRDPEVVIKSWSLDGCEAEDLRRRIKSRQKQAQRLRKQLVDAITRRRGPTPPSPARP